MKNSRSTKIVFLLDQYWWQKQATWLLATGFYHLQVHELSIFLKFNRRTFCSSFLTRKAKVEISRSKCEKSKAFFQTLLKLILRCLGEVTVSWIWLSKLMMFCNINESQFTWKSWFQTFSLTKISKKQWQKNGAKVVALLLFCSFCYCFCFIFLLLLFWDFC